MNIDHGVSLNRHCPCSQGECPIRGNCVLCIQNHLEHRSHIPECMQNILQDDLKRLANLLELTLQDNKPPKDFWDTLDKEAFVRKSLDKHVDSSEERETR